MKAWYITGLPKKDLEESSVPKDCALVTIPIDKRKEFETLFFLKTKASLFKLDNINNLKKELNLKEIQVKKFGDKFKDHEYSLLSFQDDKLYNSGIYELGTLKNFVEYEKKTDEFPKEQISEIFDKAVLPLNMMERIQKAKGENDGYKIDDIESVLDAWPFYENVYNLCETAKKAALTGDERTVKEMLQSINKNIEIVSSSKNKGDEWLITLLRFRDDLKSYVDKVSKEAINTLQKSYVDNIERDKKRREKEGVISLSFLIIKFPGIFFVFGEAEEEAEEAEKAEEEEKEAEEAEQEAEEEEKEAEEAEEGEKEAEEAEEAEENATEGEEKGADIVPTSTSVTIQLANKAFSFDKGLPAFARRTRYFLNNEGSLSKDEQGILDSLGIDKKMVSRLKSYMPKFFDVLPDCQTDTSLYLNKNCEVPYFVLWSTKFGEMHKTKEEIEKINKGTKPLSDLESGVADNISKEMSPDKSDITQLFAIIRIAKMPSKEKDDEPFDVSVLFELIKKG